MNLLGIEGLSVAIGGTPVLRDVSMQVRAGEVLGVIGESGSGKSMTAFAVMGLLPPGSAASPPLTPARLAAGKWGCA